ncbi:hypothetical protein CRENBAI_018951 [Crenichthys baileyi]|uniref:Uncharacterized protein n=1 Tax=Crenichthys baileyi TaxID=28760 RepID=A0AAV9SAQ0_9TELE
MVEILIPTEFKNYVAGQQNLPFFRSVSLDICQEFGNTCAAKFCVRIKEYCIYTHQHLQYILMPSSTSSAHSVDFCFTSQRNMLQTVVTNQFCFPLNKLDKEERKMW